jgi:hypothetical protein
MMATITSESLLPELERMIQREVAKAIEAAVDDAADKVRVKIRERLGPIACGLFNHYEMMRVGQELVIKVRIGEVDR